jgi:hypothetical protein
VGIRVRAVCVAAPAGPVRGLFRPRPRAGPWPSVGGSATVGGPLVPRNPAPTDAWRTAAARKRASNGVCAGQRGVTRAERACCKAVGSAYVGSNPTPASGRGVVIRTGVLTLFSHDGGATKSQSSGKGPAAAQTRWGGRGSNPRPADYEKHAQLQHAPGLQRCLTWACNERTRGTGIPRAPVHVPVHVKSLPAVLEVTHCGHPRWSLPPHVRPDV